ncbi:MAG: LuxR C-terminal-related transcriptional regulator [Pseudomonadota bacterium]
MSISGQTDNELVSQLQAVGKKQADLEKLNRELLETIKAVSIFSKTLEKRKIDSEKIIATMVHKKIIPLVERLRQDVKSTPIRSELNEIAANLHDLSFRLGNAKQVFTTLSPAETRVAALIKDGLDTSQIAAELGVSAYTVKTHRKNIRKKLPIYGSNENLFLFLKARMAD